MSDFLNKATNISGQIATQREKYRQSAVAAKMIPSKLKQAYKENQDSKFTEQVNEAEAKWLNAGHEGLDRFQHIENPFTRRNLADKYQTSVGAEYKNLVTEEERRQGVLMDYVQTWSDTFGAIALSEQMQAENLMSQYNMAKDIEGMRISEQERAGTGTSSKYQNRLEEMSEEVMQGKYSREDAKAILQREYPQADPNDIYKYVPDNFETKPYSYETFTPGGGSQTTFDKESEIRDKITLYVKNLRAEGYNDKKIRKKLQDSGYGEYLEEFGLE
jgi:hypothetical protein